MPAKMKTDKIAETVTPIATRVANDPELREAAKSVLDSAKTVLGKVQKDGARSGAVDKKVQDEGARRQGAEEGRGQGHGAAQDVQEEEGGQAAAAGAVAVGAVVVAKKALSKDEDEFEYTP